MTIRHIRVAMVSIANGKLMNGMVTNRNAQYPQAIIRNNLRQRATPLMALAIVSQKFGILVVEGASVSKWKPEGWVEAREWHQTGRVASDGKHHAITETLRCRPRGIGVPREC